MILSFSEIATTFDIIIYYMLITFGYNRGADLPPALSTLLLYTQIFVPSRIIFYLFYEIT